jgi:RNA 3'-terminal phosphate cyclase
MALAGGGTYRTITLSSQRRTNIDIIKKFLDVAIDVQIDDTGANIITVGPS